MQILYEDNHIIVLVKPVNIPVQADETGDIDLLSTVKAYIKEKYSKPGEVYCGLVHRLDRPVGGVMVFARTSKAASRLAPQFADKPGSCAEKRYAAVVTGEPLPCVKRRLECWLKKDEEKRKSFVVPEGTEGAKRAQLEARTVSVKGGLSLVDVKLLTGRHHQIRVQLSHAGCPIWGDQKYNPSAVPGQQIALFAYSLSFEHPTTHERMTFTALPRGGAWEGFADELRLLSAGVCCVYSDKDVLVVNKPAGVTVANADGGEDTLESRIAASGLEAYPVHRLDAKTSGLVVFARNAKAKAALDEAMRLRTIKKVYRAIVGGVPETEDGRRSGTLRFYAVKDPSMGLVKVYDAPRQGAAEMETAFRVCAAKDGVSLVEAELVTGRTHQIRASFAHIGCPILGDDRYGDREFNRDPAFRRLLKEAPLCLASVKLGFAFPKGSYLERLNGLSVSAEAPFSL
ncbi:MAG: RluA family pseudouridine synthase [Clostridia bacterium]|nr:RluA family pseudouridine synthase [Clostridia bacterium]